MLLLPIFLNDNFWICIPSKPIHPQNPLIPLRGHGLQKPTRWMLGEGRVQVASLL